VIEVVGVGTPIWSNGFGCITWMGERAAGVMLLAGGEPKVSGFVPIEQAAFWAKRWLDTCREDGRIVDESVVQ
jgi:hypothetical protein